MRFLNLLFLHENGLLEEEALEEGRRQLAEELVRLERLLAWELPLLGVFPDAEACRDNLLYTLKEIARAPESLPRHWEEFRKYLGEARQFATQLSFFTDVRIVNEHLILAGAHEAGGVDLGPTADRLPLLVEWVERQERDWKEFATLHPDQAPLSLEALDILTLVQQGVGALFLHLEGEEPAGLRRGLKAVVRGLEKLGPCVETRYLVESERCCFSSNLKLERAWRLKEKGEAEPPYLEDLCRDLLVECGMLRRRIVSAEMWEEIQPRLADVEEHLQECLEGEKGERSLELLREDATTLEELRAEVEEEAEHLKELHQYPFFQQWTELLEGVLQETVSDRELLEACSTLERSLQPLREQAGNGEPEDDVAELLGHQTETVALLRTYLEEGNGDALYQAYEALVSACFIMVRRAEEEKPESLDLNAEKLPGSTLLISLDADTTANQLDPALPERWRALAGRLAGLAKETGDTAALELLRDLSLSCVDIAENLEAGSITYPNRRGALLAGFQKLEEWYLANRPS